MLEKLSDVPELQYESLNGDTKSIVVQSDTMVRKISFSDMSSKIAEINQSDLLDRIDENSEKIRKIAGLDSDLLPVDSLESAFPYGGVIGDLIDAISKLQSDVGSLKNPVEYIFNAQHTGVSGATECFAIKAYGKTFMIDVGGTGGDDLSTQLNYASRIWKTITDNNIKHVDYLSISHWHIDHSRGIPTFYKQYKNGIEVTINGEKVKVYEAFAVKTKSSSAYVFDGNSYATYNDGTNKYIILPLSYDGEDNKEYLFDKTTKFYLPMSGPILGCYYSKTKDSSTGVTKTLAKTEDGNRYVGSSEFYSWLQELGIINISIQSSNSKVTSINDCALDTSSINKVKYTTISPNDLFENIRYPEEGDLLSLTKEYDEKSNTTIYDFEYITGEEIKNKEKEISNEFTFKFLNCTKIPCDRTILFKDSSGKYVYVDKTIYGNDYYYKYSIDDYDKYNSTNYKYDCNSIIYNDIKYCLDFNYSLEQYTEVSPFHRDMMMIQEELDDTHGKATSTYPTRYMINDYSMCFLVTHLGRTVLYGSDIMRAAQEHLMRSGLVPKGIDVYKFNHHGHNFLYGNWALSAPQWALWIHPKELVLCAGLNRNNSTNLANDTLFYGDIPMYQPLTEDVIYVTSGGSIYKKQTDIKLDFTRKNYYTETKAVIWVDWSEKSSNSNPNDINCDGTYWRPFRTVSSAMSFIGIYKDRLSANRPYIVIKCKAENDENDDYLKHIIHGYSKRTKNGIVENSGKWRINSSLDANETSTSYDSHTITSSNIGIGLGTTVISEHYYRNGFSGTINTKNGKIKDERKQWIKLYHFGGKTNLLYGDNIRFIGLWFAPVKNANGNSGNTFELTNNCNLTLQSCIIDNLHYNGNLLYDVSNAKNDVVNYYKNEKILFKYNKVTDVNITTETKKKFESVSYYDDVTNSLSNGILGTMILGDVEPSSINKVHQILRTASDYTAIYVDGNNCSVRIDACEFLNYANVVYIAYSTNSKAIFNCISGDLIDVLCRGGSAEHINPHLTIHNLALSETEEGINNRNYISGNPVSKDPKMHVYSDVKTISYSDSSDYTNKSIFAQSFTAKSKYSSSLDLSGTFSDNSYISKNSKTSKTVFKINELCSETDDNPDIINPNYGGVAESEDDIASSESSSESSVEIIDEVSKLYFFESLLKMYRKGISWIYGNDSGMDVNIPYKAKGLEHLFYYDENNSNGNQFRVKTMLNDDSIVDAYGGDLVNGSVNVEMLSGGTRLNFIKDKYLIEENGTKYFDLNSLKMSGTYVSHSTDLSTYGFKIKNSPSGINNSFVLIVKDMGVSNSYNPVEQIIKHYSGIYKRKYTKVGSSYSWTNWGKEQSISTELNNGEDTYTILFN